MNPAAPAWVAAPRGSHERLRALVGRLGSDKLRLVPWPGDSGPHAAAELHLPAEALLRLFAGRLDPAHTPAEVTATVVDLDTLREAFPGF